MSVTGRAFESRINVLLSELLTEHGVISRSELISMGRRDVVVYHQGLVCVLEGSYSRSDAERDAKRRIEQLSADIALAVHYNPEIFPQHLTEPQIKDRILRARLPVRVVVPEDISGTLFEVLHRRSVIARPVDEWYDLDFNSLTTLLQEIGQFILTEEAIERVESEVGDFINRFVEFLSHHRSSREIARNLYSVLYKLYGFSIGRPESIKEAIFAQATLAILLSSIYYETVRYAHNLRSLREQDPDPHNALSRAFRDILEVDYREIFRVSKEMLGLLPHSIRLFESTINIATRIASQKTLLRRDFAGRIYHRVVGEWSLRKGLATYFTEIPSAYLLAYIGKPNLSRICDFAAGSGTLLVATYSAANSAYRFSLLRSGVERNPEDIEREFHRRFIESCYGFDVLSYATQITAINLALHSPETPLDGFLIFAVPLGAKNGDISLGSLELVRRHGSIWDSSTIVEQAGLDERQERLLQEVRNIQPFDFVIMNPPFTRATGRGGREGGGLFGFIADSSIRAVVTRKYERFREEVRSELLDHAGRFLNESNLGFLLKDRDFAAYRSIGQAGEGLLFINLANKMVREGGKICFVLPKNLLSATSWFLARVLLASKYHLETVVVSYDSEGGYNFSESTSLSECLFVAKKVTSISETDETRFLILLKKPKTSVEAIALANKLEENREYTESGRASAFAVRVKRHELDNNLDNWGRFVFLPNLKLLKQIKELLSGVIEIGDRRGRVPLIRLNDLITSIGIDAHQFSDNFRVVSGHVPGSRRIVYGGDEEIRKIMKIIPNSWAIPDDSGNRLFREKAGKLLIPDRIRINTAHVISMFSADRVLSNIFYALRLKEEDDYKLRVLCLWLNTTWGVLTILANKQETEGGWIRLKMSQWRLLPVLDVNNLPQRTLRSLSNIFENFKESDLGRIPFQYRPDSCSMRKRLDIEFLETIGISAREADLMDLYREIDSSMRQWLGN